MALKLVRYLANLGYGSRREVMALLRAGRVSHTGGGVLSPDANVAHDDLRVDGQALDPAPGMLVMLHKPVGYTCSHADAGRVIYQLLPPRWLLRKPTVSSIGRLDRDTSGLLLLTDDGALLHRIISPRAHVAKTYEATLAEPLRGDEGEIFASGMLTLRSEHKPLAAARLQVLAPHQARVTVTEGRYHQVRRMFAAVGNRVLTLQRISIGSLTLGALAAGQWRMLDEAEKARVLVAGVDGQEGATRWR